MVEIKDFRVIETSYEDGSSWLECETLDGFLFYEILEKEDNISNCLTFEEKRSLDELSPTLKTLIDECRLSSDDMLFIEADDEDYDINALMEEVEKLELSEYIEFSDDPLLTMYGGIITLFKFPVRGLI